MIERITEILRSWGVDDIAFNSHCHHEQVRRWVDDYRRCAEREGQKLKLRVSYEPEILGTGGVLNPLREWIGEENFYLVNGDIIFENALSPAGALEIDDPSVIASCLISESGPRTIEVEPEYEFVTNWRSEDSGANGTFTYCGVACLKPEILKYVKEDGFSSIVSAYEKAMLDGKFVKAILPREMLWTDAGTIPAYIELNSSEDGENAFAYFPQIQTALRQMGCEFSKVEFLGARGSERVFFKCDKGIIIIYDDGNRDENALYAGHARWLASKGISVPAVLADSPVEKVLALEFAGVDKVPSLEEYKKVIEVLSEFNALGEEADKASLGLLPGFDHETWTWERGLFTKYCLERYFNLAMPDDVSEELKKVAEMLEKEPKALVHRDFQSTNVMWKNGKPVLIDFQGMRLGPALYDLASLVYDPYVKLSAADRQTLAQCYADLVSRPDIPSKLPFAGVQRLVQCLGAFGRLASVGQPKFAKYLAPALVNLREAAEKASLSAIERLAQDLLAKSDKDHAKHCSCCS
jgi:aminoglycoside/choline kinase family phosphotransferase/dTDP-glucose pyrophosphorylase